MGVEPGRGIGRIRSRFVAALLLAALLLLAGRAQAQSLAAGEDLFRRNRPQEAIPYLEKAILEPGVDERAWLYLGYSLRQVGRLDEAIAVFRKGLAASTSTKPLYYYNMGSVYIAAGKNAFAEETLGQAIDLDPAYANAYLNRANSRLAQAKYKDAASDYRRYLELEPAAPQRGLIEELLGKLGAALAEEDRRVQAETARVQAEEEARKALLDSIAASLRAAAEETTSLSAGSGSLQGYAEELELDE